MFGSYCKFIHHFWTSVCVANFHPFFWRFCSAQVPPLSKRVHDLVQLPKIGRHCCLHSSAHQKVMPWDYIVPVYLPALIPLKKKTTIHGLVNIYFLIHMDDIRERSTTNLFFAVCHWYPFVSSPPKSPKIPHIILGNPGKKKSPVNSLVFSNPALVAPFE